MKVVVLVVKLYENVDSGCRCQLACEIDISLTISATLRHGAEKIFSLQKYKRKEKKKKEKQPPFSPRLMREILLKGR